MVKPQAFAAAALVVASAGCDDDVKTWDHEQVPDRTAASAKPPVDRLAAGELAPGELKVFGFPIPRKMKLELNHGDRAYMVGTVRPEDVSNYVRKHVSVAHVEVGAGKTVFPRARIHGDTRQRDYRIDVIASGADTKLVIRDVTKPKATEGLSQAERWKRAGYSANGKPLNEKTAE